MTTSRSPKTKAELHAAAVALAEQYQLVKHNAQLFVPVQWDNPVVSKTPPAALETVWLPMRTEDLLDFGNTLGGILFQNSSEFTSFVFMLKQEAAKPSKPHTDEIFIKTANGLKVLNSDGGLDNPNGDFIPNIVTAKLNEDADDKAYMFGIVVEWLGAEEAAHSLLYHLATALAPGWSAAKFVLLLGKGRNGKSTLLKMLEALLGKANVSHVTRQQMALREPAIVDINNKLANIVFDAEDTYIKNSSVEKTLVVGEPVGVRMLYENGNTDVWTNGLFLEGLQEEPRTRDKSNAMQRRLVRFWFPNEYPLDRKFEQQLLSERYLGAFLSLLLDHYVKVEEASTKLVPSQVSYDLQVDQLWLNSKTFQYLHELVTKDPKIVDKILGMDAQALSSQFHAWLTGGKDDYSAVDAYRMLKECYVLKRKSVRDNGSIKKVWVVDSFTPDAKRMIERITEEEEDDAVLDAAGLVDD